MDGRDGASGSAPVDPALPFDEFRVRPTGRPPRSPGYSDLTLSLSTGEVRAGAKESGPRAP